MTLKPTAWLLLIAMAAVLTGGTVGCDGRDNAVVSGETEMTPEELAEEQEGIAGVSKDY